MATTATIMDRSNFAELLTPVHKKIFFDSYNEKPEQYSQVFKKGQMNKKEETFPHMGALGIWSSNTEGSNLNEQKFTEGDKATFTARRFDNSYKLTWELIQDDLYNVMKGLGKGGSAKGLGRGLRATQETDAVTVITGGFDNTGYDGSALFASNHDLASSSSTGDNLIEGVLNDSNLKAALTKMRATVDEANIIIAAQADKLFIGPEWEFTAKTLLQSTQLAGSPNNDKNVLPSLNLVILDYLGSSTIWGIIDSSIENLMFLDREKAWFDSAKIENTVDYKMYGYARWDCGYVDWRGIVASKGEAPSEG